MKKHDKIDHQLDLGVDHPSPSIDPPDLLACDKWIASSAMQKAIRRGDVVTAQRAAATFHHADPRAVWRRLLIIAVEDVGIGSPEALIETALRASDPKLRRWMGGELTAILDTCQLLASSPKSRNADHLISTGVHDPALETVREECGGSSVQRRIEIVADRTRPLPERAIAAWHGCGLEAGREHRVGVGDFAGLMRAFADLGVPTLLLDAVGIAARKTREPIIITIPLLWLAADEGGTAIVDHPPPETALIDGVPVYALDGHTRLGRQAIRQFRRENREVSELLDGHVLDHRVARVLQLAVFYADSAVIRPCLVWPGSEVLEARGVAADFHSAETDPAVGVQLIEIVVRHLPQLNAIRADLLTRGGVRPR